MEEIAETDPAADLAAEEENKLINEVYIECRRAGVVGY